MKIKLKRSNQLVNGEAKQPDIASMEYGELAVNFNSADPCIFVRASDGAGNDEMVRIAGSGTGSVTLVEDGTLSAPEADDYPEGTLWFNSAEEDGNLYVLYDDPAPDAGKKWIQITGAGGSGGGDAGEEAYVQLNGDGTAQVITGTGGLKVEGLVEAGGGVKVTGGTVASVVDGINLSGSGDLQISKDSEIRLKIEDDVNTFTDKLFVSTPGDGTTNTLRGITSQVKLTAGEQDVIHFSSQNNGLINYATSVKAFEADFAGVKPSDDASNPNRGYGFYSNLAISSTAGTELFNFFAGRQAANFFAGSTYIGGSTARNTRELWESTLTEEQLEQLEAGTLAAPANVSTPGDGSFARAWYYDQQDEETQLALDSGELEYPEHLAAATFTDTFTLGEKTKINLNANGLGEFKGGVKVSGGTESSVDTGLYSEDPGNEIKIAVNGAEVARLYEGIGLNMSIGQLSQLDSTSGSITNFQARYNGTGHGSQNFTNIKSLVTADTGIADSEVNGFLSAVSNHNGADVQIAGYHSSIYTSNAPNGTAYNFYAPQNAPNFFRGDTYIGGSVSRNTRELWESTLTEEQKEQLSAGTLAIPANVSVPGDGSFARQWWYNQQSAEDQALIDSGELDYPSHFQAANFVDTFALGDATNIDFIAADGTVKLKGISFNKGATTADKIDFNGFYFSNFHNCPLLLASCHSDSDTEVTALKVTPYAYYPETDKNKNLTKAIGLYLESPIVTQGDNDDALLDDIRTIGIQGHDAAKLSENGSSYCISSFQNNPGSAEIALGKTAYNFYADGTAPNYFSGTVIVSKDTNSTSEILGGTKAGMYFNASTGGIAINKDDNNGNLNLMQCMRGGTATTRRFLDFRFFRNYQ